MNNNQNLSNNSSFGMLNNGQVNSTPQNNNLGLNNSNNQSNQVLGNQGMLLTGNVVNYGSNQSQNPVGAVPNANSVAVNTTQSNAVTLGTVSNVTYADTIGDINYDTQPQGNVTPSDNTSETFINNNYNETSLSDLNVEGTYNNMNVSQDYMNDPKVMENIHPDSEKKKTITIGKELKTFILIALVLLVFIFVLPILANIFNKIRFH